MSTEIENMARDLAMKGYAENTQRRYLKCVERLIQGVGKPAGQLSRDELREYVTELCRKSESRSSLQLELCALLFFYRKTLGKPEQVSFISLPKQYSALPIVLTEEEVQAVFDQLRSPLYRAMAMVMYGAGLRIEETLQLEVGDIDGPRGVIRVRHGKGNKAREAKLSPMLYGALRSYWQGTRPPGPLLFATRQTGKPPSRQTVTKALKKAAEEVRVDKRVSCHVLRHSFATHLLEQGVDAYVVSALLGHASLKATKRYARVTRKIIKRVPSPLDLLPKGRPPARPF
jgi:site-specific recombinase XerD